MREPPASAIHHAFHRLSRAAGRALVPVRLRSVTTLGRRARVNGAPFVQNQGRIAIGDDLQLDSWPVRSHLVTGRRGVIEIGNGVSIGAGTGISSEAHVRIGDGVRLGRAVIIIDTDYHDRRDFTAEVPSVPVVIEAGARLGPRVTVLKGARIGPGAWIGAGSVVSGVIRAGTCASGVPARVIPGAEGPGPSRPGAPASDLLERIGAVLAETFQIAIPDPAHGPAEIAAWDSLGSLRLLLALEEEFGIVLPEALGDARNLHELCDVVSARLRDAGGVAYRAAER